MVIQNELGCINGYSTDYENTEKQEFEELCGYAAQDSQQGDCSVEWVWDDISKALINALGIITYGSLLAFINPLVFLVVAVVSVISYFTTRWQSTYREKHKHEWEKEVRKVTYLQDLSDNFPVAKDIKLYGMEGWLEKMLRDYQSYVFMWNKRCSLRGAWASVLAAVMTLIQDGAAYIYLVALLLDGIYSKFDEIVGDKTAIYISHRLSSCRFCDKIAVFDHGEIVQIGTHEELLADPTGKYYELWHAQAQYYTEKTA